ncbi:DUF3768 domain-containing protein [Parvularcula sp. LCG005]|uniref:DUF3768 domain-containing protein n=1 Tax=Parvularcula sp. LCG005 TaxID=3078805 RepID=UPI00294287B6|nr:DUF3768 domain-containing protein [Parvularcula sp. LCG005]WOI52579.1 DUF3768 domain-containing protein [Parvularcula sp. LCG005]
MQNEESRASTHAQKAQAIATLNDRFRSRLHIPVFGRPDVPGTFLLTSGITQLSPLAQVDILARVRGFDSFTEDNDPYGEHDFGSLDHAEAGKVFWKIDYYADDSCMYGSEHPEDPSSSYRVLTIMLASEY